MELALPLAVDAWAVGISLGSVIALVLAFSAGISVLRNSDLSGSAKAMWLLAIAFVPIFGSVVYFGVRSDW